MRLQRRSLGSLECRGVAGIMIDEKKCTIMMRNRAGLDGDSWWYSAENLLG